MHLFFRPHPKTWAIISWAIASGIHALSVALSASATGVSASTTAALAASPNQVTDDARSFIYWCDRRTTAPPALRLTLDLLLEQAKTQDCRQAHRFLRNSTELVILNGRLSNLEPISWYPQLKRLVIRQSAITDLSPLAQLTQLESLDLSGTPIIPFGLLTSERRSHTVDNQQKQFQVKPGKQDSDIFYQDLSGQTAPGGLEAERDSEARTADERPFVWGNIIQPTATNQISDLQPLSSLTQLRELHLGGNQITDIRPLVQLPHLEVLSLHSNPLRYLDALAQMPQLRYLDVNSVQSRDFGPVSRLHNLERLNLANNGIDDLRLVQRLKRLQLLDLSMNQIDDLRPLVYLPGLRWLNLDHNRITDISPLAKKSTLEALYLRDNHIRNVQPLLGLVQLRELMAWDNPLVQPQCPVQRDDQSDTNVCQFRVPGGVFY